MFALRTITLALFASACAVSASSPAPVRFHKKSLAAHKRTSVTVDVQQQTLNAAFTTISTLESTVKSKVAEITTLLDNATGLSVEEIEAEAAALVKGLEGLVGSTLTQVTSIAGGATNEIDALAAELTSEGTTEAIAQAFTNVVAELSSAITVLQQAAADIPGLSSLVITVATIIDGPLNQILAGLDSIVGGVLKLVGNLLDTLELNDILGGLVGGLLGGLLSNSSPVGSLLGGVLSGLGL